MLEAWIGLGSNLEDPVAQVKRAIEELGALPHSRLTGISSLYRSEPVSSIEQDDFINAVARLETSLSPHSLLDALQALEQIHHRRRSEGVVNGPRTLDLDLLCLGDETIRDDRLTLPHPRMAERLFVLIPMQEIDPELELPHLGRIDDLIASAPPMRLVKLD